MSPRWLLACLFLFTVGLGYAQTPMPVYPTTKMEKVVDVLHGVTFTDPYRWLEEGDSPAVKDWVDSQNKYTQQVLGKVQQRAEIRRRLNQLLDIGALGTPTPAKGHYFYTKREGEQNQPVLYVRDGVNGKDRVLVDPNLLAKEGTTALDWWFPSKDGKLVAFGISENGSEQSTLYVRDVATGKDLGDVIPRARYASIAWLPDNTGFYYTRYPAVGSVPKGQENYNRHAYFHKLGTDTAKDEKIFGEGRAPEDMISVQISPDGRWLAATVSQGWARSEIYLRDNQSADKKFVPLVKDVAAIFNVILRNDRFYVLTNQDAPRYRLLRVDPKKTSREQWVELIPQDESVLEEVTDIGDTLVAGYMQDASARLKLFNEAGKPLREIELPTLGTLAGIHGEWDGDELFFGFQSFTTAASVYRVDLTSKKQELWQRVETDIDPANYQVEQVRYPSKDGTLISMFLASKKGIAKTGKTPTLLYGYGGFNISLTPVFAPTRFMILEQGGLLAIANLRGGGEYGEDWHRAGMLDKKQNTFDDFIAAAEWLVANKHTDREHLAIQGGSNGGLLVGAALTQRPDLFKAVVCQVPLLDMLRYHKFLIARLWIPEYGSAEDAEQFKWINAYSPYQHVKGGTAYPAVLITTAASDSRVDPSHARKMVAKLQAATSSPAPILLRQETRAGHGAGKPRSLTLDEQTDIWSFLYREVVSSEQ